MSLTAQSIAIFIAALALCLAIQVPHAYSQNPERETGNSTIRGVVTYSDTGRPVRYASVRVRNDRNGGWHQDGVTNRNGEFVVKNVPAGHYIVFVHSHGILEPSFFPGPGSFLARLRLSGETFTEAVVNGTDSVDVKVQAVRGGVITGRVVTEDDQPLANADIKLLKRENGQWTPVAATWTAGSSAEKQIKTDAGGVYRVAGLVAGEYLVRVSEGDTRSDSVSDRSHAQDGVYTNGFFMAAYYPSATSIKDAQTVTVIEGSESTGVDIRMPERPVHTISGTVKFSPGDGQDDQSAKFAEILIERADEIGYANQDDGVVTVRADDNGKWEMRGLPAGDYSIRLGGAVQLGAQDQGSYVIVAPKRISVRVDYDDVVVPEIKLSQGSLIIGKVTWDGKPPKNPYQFNVRAIPASQLSAAATDAELHSQDPSALGILTGSLNTEGQFLIPGVPAGKYSIRLWGLEEDNYYVQSMTRKGVDLKQSMLKVGEDSEIRDIVIALATDFATVEGQLTRRQASQNASENASPKLDLQDVVVILAPANDATRRLNRGLITVQPDAQGKFAVNCPPGEYFMTAVTSAEIKKLAKPIDEDYFKQDNQKIERVKVKAKEKVKGLTVPVGVN